MRQPETRITLTPPGAADAGTVAVARPVVSGSTPITAEWKTVFPYAVAFDPGGLYTYLPVIGTNTTEQIDPGNPVGMTKLLYHPTHGIIANGFNCVFWQGGGARHDDVNNLSDIIEANNLGGRMYQVWFVGGAYDVSDLKILNDWVFNEAADHSLDGAKAFATPNSTYFASHPSVLAYHMYDDMFDPTYTARVLTMIEAFRDVDPYQRPATGVPVVPAIYTQMWASDEVELALTYAYPCQRGMPEGDFHRSGFEGDDFDGELRQFCAPLPKINWIYLQVHQTVDETGLRYPTAREIRKMVWMTVGEGVKGIVWFLGSDQENADFDNPALPSVGLLSKGREDVLASVSEMSDRLTPEIRARLLASERVAFGTASNFTASGGGGGGGNANAYCSTLYDATSDARYCVVCNHALTTSNVTINSTTHTGWLVSLENGNRYKIGRDAISLPALDGTILLHDLDIGVPHWVPDNSLTAEQDWARHWANPASSEYRATILKHANEVFVPVGQLQDAIDASRSGTTFLLEGNGAGNHGHVTCVGKERLHFTSFDTTSQATWAEFHGIDLWGDELFAQYNGNTTDPRFGLAWLLQSLRDPEILYLHKNPKRDFLFTNLVYRRFGTLLSEYRHYFIQGVWQPDHRLTNIALMARNVTDVCVENCHIIIDYKNDGWLGGVSPGATDNNVWATYTYIEQDATHFPPTHYALFSGNSGINNICIRNNTWEDQNTDFSARVFYDGARGCCFYGNTADNDLGFHSHDIILFTNDDLSTDIDADGIISADQDERNSWHNFIVNNDLGFGSAPITIQGRGNLVKDNNYSRVINLPAFVEIGARASRFYPNYGGHRYLHFDNVVDGNTFTGGNITQAFVQYRPQDGFDQDRPQYGQIGLVGRTTIKNNTVVTGTVAEWAADHPQASPYVSEGGDTITNNADVNGPQDEPWADLGVVPTIASVSTADGRKIHTLREWQGRIYMGYGDSNFNQPTAINAIAWDTVSQSYVTLSGGTLNANSNYSLRVVNNELWMVSNDAASGTHMEYAVVDASHALTIVNSGGSINGYHLFDSLYFGGNPYLCGAAWQSISCSDGAIWRQSGGVWTKVLNVVPSTCNGLGYRIYGLFAIGSTIYAGVFGQSLRSSTDGTTWTSTGISFTNRPEKAMNVSGGVIFKSDYNSTNPTTSLRRFNGTADTSVIASGVQDVCLDPSGIPYVLIGTEIRTGNATGTTFTTTLSDVPANAQSLCVTATHYYIGTSDSHVWRKPR